ncbi:MAG TPA: ATP-binding protein [Thermoanaerobaculia bacterium]
MRQQKVAPARGLQPVHALAGALVLLLAGIVASIYQDRTFHEQRLRELTVQAEILAASVTAALVFDDSQTVQEHVSALAINRAVAAAGVHDRDRNLIASIGTGSVTTTAAGQSEPSGPGSTVHTSVMHEGEAIGYVYIREREEPLSLRIARHVPMMLLAIMAALFVALMGTLQRTLHEANRQLEVRAVTLAETNQMLQSEMEERSRAEEALRQSQKMEAVGQLAGGVAHDFNNLLTIIRGNLHLLRQTRPEGREETDEFIVNAELAADRAGHLVRRLLSFSRRQPPSSIPVHLNDIARGMQELIAHSVGKNVQVVWTLSSTWETVCDTNQMENVILNLAINARDAMPDGGTVTIETVDLPGFEPEAGELQPGDYVALRVRDTGIGMSGDVSSRAIEPFFTTKPHGEGTGLGLSTAFAFARHSRGHLQIESAPGSGTTVTILLPRHRIMSEEVA